MSPSVPRSTCCARAARLIVLSSYGFLAVAGAGGRPLHAAPPTATASSPAAALLSMRWLYLQRNLQVREELEKALALLERARAAGYNGLVLADYKLNILDRVPDFYFDHARLLLAKAKALGIEVIPAVAPFGYSDGLLAHDPSLAEGLPVRDAPFLVQADGSLALEGGGRSLLPGGAFEEHRGDLAAGWDFQDAPGQASFIDVEVRHGGASSLRWEDPGQNARESSGNARVSRKVAVAPWRQYHASVWIRTRAWEEASSVRLFAMAAQGRVLSHSDLGVKPTQEWTQHHVVFNSLENAEVRIYCGTWGGGRGKLWMDDLALEETAFVNLLRRDGCPLEVRGEDGTVYEEGRDFAPLRDPRMGSVPWAGGYEVWHEPPRLARLEGSRLGAGQRVLVSFYPTVTVHDGQVACCLADPGVFRVLEAQVRSVAKLLEPQTYFLSHDEIRVANWCGSCNREGRSAGALLAENVRRVAEIVRGVTPGARLCIWSDMFDPSHNAHDGYYLVQGDLAGSWEGLPANTMVVNWNHEMASISLPFFAKRGHPQVLAGFYDGAPDSIAGWLSQGAGLRLGGAAPANAEPTVAIAGAMYTTWRGDYSQLEAFARAAWGGK